MKALVVGATGLVGTEMVRQLSERTDVEEVRALVRRSLGTSRPRVREFVVDFEGLEANEDAFTGVEVVFSALGTTLKTAGSKEAQRRVDYDYQLAVARLGVAAGARAFVLVSSAGADPRSVVFYSRMKGELEEAVRTLGYPSLFLLRPGILDGPRSEKRPGERLALRALRFVPSFEAFASLRPIPASTVARAGIRLALGREVGSHVLEARELFRLGDEVVGSQRGSVIG